MCWSGILQDARRLGFVGCFSLSWAKMVTAARIMTFLYILLLLRLRGPGGTEQGPSCLPREKEGERGECLRGGQRGPGEHALSERQQQQSRAEGAGLTPLST